MPLPIVLAGPIVRHSEGSHVLLWFATSSSTRFTAEAYVLRPPKLAKIGAGSTVRELQLGENLYVQIVEIKPDGSAFPLGVSISYDVFIDRGGAKAKSRASIFDGLVERGAICLPGLKLPEIVIAGTGRVSARLYFGSCRKVGGIGTDASAVMDAELAETTAIGRANALLLLGDQIYGDDVPGVVSEAVFSFAKRLAGSWFSPPTVDFEKRYFQRGSRGALTRLGDRGNATGFTVGEGAGFDHLLTEYEYAAVHLLSWNDALWDEAINFGETARRSAKAMAAAAIGTGVPPDLKAAAMVSALDAFRKSTRRMRRVLANVPTYMLFDDHDVTDDWNLDQKWTARLTDFGKRVVGSAMIVYAAFQNWGNRKDAKTDAAIDLIERYYSSRRATSANLRPGRAPSITISEDLLKLSWSFCVKASPGIVFLDTRTKREKANLAQIVSIGRDFVPFTRSVRADTVLAGSRELINFCAMSKGAKSALILATPTPVLSHFYVESLKSLLVSLEGAFLSDELYRRDVEDWLANPESLFRLIDALASLEVSKFLVVSGDVHYSFSTSARITCGGSKKLELLQLCSSAINNELDAAIQKAVRAIDKSRSRTIAWWWKPDDSVAGCLLEPNEVPAQFEYMKSRFGGEPDYLIELEIFPLDWYPASAGTASVQFLNSIGRVTCLPDRVQGMHLSPVGNGVHKSRTVDLMFK